MVALRYIKEHNTAISANKTLEENSCVWDISE